MSQQAYIGPWIDHSRNVVLGATITLSSHWGSLLISGLSVIVTAAGAAAWTICAFALHQIYATNDRIDALSFQHQIGLRNSGTAMGSVLEFLKIGWAQRASVPRARLRAWSFALVPLSFFIGFAIASVFVAKVYIPAYEVSNVLLKSGNCGLVAYNPNSMAGVFAGSNKVANDTRTARDYANKCYHSTPGTLGCSILPIQSLPYNSTASALCPFQGPGRCVTGDQGAFQMDTGLLDSHVHLGINAPLKDRVSFQMRTTCSVISAKDWTSVYPDTTASDGSVFIEYNLGPIENVTTYTFGYSNHTIRDIVPYTITSVYSLLGYDSGFEPRQELNRTDADINFHFVAPNSVLYTQPVLDPFFSANGTNMRDGYYTPDEYVHIMGCADQRRMCNAATGGCTALSGQSQVAFKSLGLNLAQTATAERIFLAWKFSDTYNVVSGQNGDALKATSKLYQLFSPGLPSNQWQLELQGWFETSLAALQFAIVDFVSNTWAEGFDGPIGVEAPQSWEEPDKDAMQAQCGQQKVQSTDAYQSFSTLGVALTAGLSGVIIVLSWTLSTCVFRGPDRRLPEGRNYYKKVAWFGDGKQQLGRMALMGSGYQEWEETTLDEVPVPKSDVAAPTAKNIGTVMYEDTVLKRVGRAEVVANGHGNGHVNEPVGDDEQNARAHEDDEVVADDMGREHRNHEQVQRMFANESIQLQELNHVERQGRISSV